MSSLVDRVCEKAAARSIPFSVQMDLTWRCNENCAHCYLDHRVAGEMNTAETKDALDQLAAAGTFFLCLSGGEIMLRKDVFDVIAHARSLLFDVRLKTNGTLIGEAEAARLARLGVREVHISVYSHRPEIHDAVTGAPGSLARSLEALRSLTRHRVAAEMRTPLMRNNAEDYPQLRALAEEMGIKVRFDPTITPRLDGDRAPVGLGIPGETLRRVFRDPNIVLDVERYCAAPDATDEHTLSNYPCAAGYAACYISPQADVMPCVQFALICGNLRQSSFAEIWRSPEFRRIRKTRNRDLPVCSSCANLSVCTRCPGLAMMDGDVLGPSRLDCEKAYARTGVSTPLVP